MNRNVLSRWAKVSLSFPLPLYPPPPPTPTLANASNKESSVVIPEQDLCQMPQVRRPGNEGDQDRMQICEEHGGSGGV